jgi:hypothetical protein
MPRRTVLVTILAALLLLGACGPAGDGGTAFGEADLEQAVADVTADLEELGASFEGELGVAALASFPGFVVVAPEPVPPPSAGTLSLGLIRPAQTTSLPRGIWTWDADAFDWVEVGPSTDLVLRWSFVDAADDAHTANITVDWGVTTQVRDASGELVEVPRAMNVTMTVDTTLVVADVDAEFDWYTAAACTEGILEPGRVYVDGSLGADATLALNAITLELTPVSATDAQIAANGEVVASADGDRAGLSWDVTLTGPLTRGTDCFVDAFEPRGGAVDVLLFSEQAGVTSSFGVDFTFQDVVLDDVTGEPVSVDLDGDLTVDGAAAVTFSGTLDDEDADGIPGDNLVLVFANGDTTTLEAFIENQLQVTTTTAMRVLSLFR